MVTTSFYPVLMSSDVPAAAVFYREHLGFETVYDSSWYVSLRQGVFELALLAHDHETVPVSHRALPQGMLLNLEVDDVHALHDQLKTKPGIVFVQPLRSEDFGQLHFILEGPDRVLIDVIQPIEPTEEYKESFIHHP